MRDFQMPGRSPVHGTEAMAATSHPLATETAIDTLRAGGTAADAAVAACAVLCVVEPHMVSPAGDTFWIVGKPGKPLEGYNGSGRSAKAATLGWFVNQGYKGIPEGDVHAVTVPGALDAWDALLQRHGRFGLDRNLQRAIEVAERGHAFAPLRRGGRLCCSGACAACVGGLLSWGVRCRGPRDLCLPGDCDAIHVKAR
jgi:gamma-glutamyltranspeptidase/glutathione hydrolase